MHKEGMDNLYAIFFHSLGVQQPNFVEKWELMVASNVGSSMLHATSWALGLHHCKLSSCLHHRCAFSFGQKKEEANIRGSMILNTGFAHYTQLHHYWLVFSLVAIVLKFGCKGIRHT